jgi:hypothetical protein
MKEIFTFPNNALTSYIDPRYVGDATVGFQKRIQDLKDGTYKTWDGTAPIATVDELMSNISAFATNYYDNIGDNNITIHDMYQYPLLVGDVSLDDNIIVENITSISAPVNSPAVMTTSVPQVLTDGNYVLLEQFDGAISGPLLNNTYMYIQNATTSTFNLSYDAAGSELLGNYSSFTSSIDEFTTANNNLSLKLTNTELISDGIEMLIPTIGDREIFLSQTSTSMSNEKAFFKDDSGSVRVGSKNVGSGTNIVLIDMYYDPIGEDHLDRYTANIVIPNETLSITAYDISDDGNTIRLRDNSSTNALGVDIFIQNSTPGSDGWTIIRRTNAGLDSLAKMDGDGTKVMSIQSGTMKEYVISTDITTSKTITSTYLSDGNYLWVNSDASKVIYTADGGTVTDKLVLYNYSGNYQSYIIDKVNTVFTINDKWGYIIGSDQNSGIVNYYEMTNSAINLLATVDTGVTTNLQWAPLCAATSITHQFAVFAGYDKIIYEYDTTALTVTEIYRLNTNYPSGPRLINDVDRGTFYEVEGLMPPIVGRCRRGADAMLNYIKRNNINIYMKAHATLTDYYDLYTDVAVTTKWDWTTIPNGNFTALPGTPVRTLTSTVNPLTAYVLDATQGEVTWDGPDSYNLTSINLFIPGQQQYQYLDANDVLLPGAEINTVMFTNSDNQLPAPTETFPGNVAPNITLTTDANGRLTGATLNQVQTGWDRPRHIVFGIEALPDQTTSTSPLLAKLLITVIANGGDLNDATQLLTAIEGNSNIEDAAAEDVFDTQDQWLDREGWASGQKIFGMDIIPSSAVVTYNQPSTVNKSQNGTKYVRNAGFLKTKLEVNYDCLTEAEFQILHSDVQAARGQATKFQIITGQWGHKVLSFKNEKSTRWPRLVKPYTQYETLLTLGGFQSNESEVYKKGEMFSLVGFKNGGGGTVLNTIDANVYGEAKIRVSYGGVFGLGNGAIVNKYIGRLIVTLDSDEFQYSVDTFGKYNVTIEFELGDWYS